MGEAEETRVQSLAQEDLLEEEMATHSSILAWKIPCTDWWTTAHGLHRVGHSEVTEHMHISQYKIKSF